MPFEISILELLHIPPTHNAVLDKALQESLVPTDINVDEFKAMVGNLPITHHVTFVEHDVVTHKPNHNDPLHLEVFVHKHKIR